MDKQGKQTHGLLHSHDFTPFDFCTKCKKPKFDDFELKALFISGLSTLEEVDEDQLNSLANHLINHPTTVIELAGHTDNVGSKEDNQILSQNRAKTIADYLVNKGANTHNIKTIGYGESQPKVSNDTKEGRHENRRVVVRIIHQ